MTTKTATQILDSLITRADLVAATRLESRAKVVEKINADYILSSFDYDALIEGDAKASVWLGIKDTIESARTMDDKDDEDGILGYVQRMINRSAIHFRIPGSSSASNNQMELEKHGAWIEALSVANPS